MGEGLKATRGRVLHSPPSTRGMEGSAQPRPAAPTPIPVPGGDGCWGGTAGRWGAAGPPPTQRHPEQRSHTGERGGGGHGENRERFDADGGGGSGEASGNSYFQETRINLSLFKPYGANAIGRLSMLHSRNSRASKASFALGVSFPHGLCSVQRTARLKRQER